MRQNVFVFALTSFLFILPTEMSAHDLWVSVAGEAASRRIIVNYGHPDDRPPTVAEKIVDLVAIDLNGQRSILAGAKNSFEDGIGIVSSKPLTESEPTLYAARYDNGFWTTNSDGDIRNTTRRLVSNAQESLWSGKFAKAVSAAGAPWSKILGHDLEIVPLTDPGLARLGSVLKVKVLFKGEPLGGAEVERGDSKTVVAENDIPRYRTNYEGIAEIPIERSGPQLLVVDHRAKPSRTPDQATLDLFNATLWFVMKE